LFNISSFLIIFVGFDSDSLNTHTKALKLQQLAFFFFFPQYGLKTYVITLCFFSKTSILAESLGYSRDQAPYTTASKEGLKKSQYSFA
jgi:Na+/alanine symporter